MVTAVPPAVGPLLGVIAVTVGGGGVYVYRSIPVPVPIGVVTVTFTGPSACAGVTAVMVVSLTKVNATELPPIVTEVAPVKAAPVMVIGVPPAREPFGGLTDVTVG